MFENLSFKSLQLCLIPFNQPLQLGEIEVSFKRILEQASAPWKLFNLVFGENWMLNNKNFTILSAFSDCEDWVEKMQFRFNCDTVEEDVGVLKTDNLVMGA